MLKQLQANILDKIQGSKEFIAARITCIPAQEWDRMEDIKLKDWGKIHTRELMEGKSMLQLIMVVDICLLEDHLQVLCMDILVVLTVPRILEMLLKKSLKKSRTNICHESFVNFHLQNYSQYIN